MGHKPVVSVGYDSHDRGIYVLPGGELYYPNRSWYKPRNKTTAVAFYYDMVVVEVEVFRALLVAVNSGPNPMGGNEWNGIHFLASSCHNNEPGAILE